MIGGVARPMTRADLELALTWAEAEGWNPGREDAEAFLAADPGGFLMAEVDGAPAASLSIVRSEGEHAFLGLYICRPDLRGRGVGHALWREEMDRLAQRSVGLDGAPAQQANYARSGFAPSHRTIRFCGVAPAPAKDGTEPLGPAHLGPTPRPARRSTRPCPKLPDVRPSGRG